MNERYFKFKILHHTDQKTIEDMYRAYSPVFILSTGRAGSKFLASLLGHSFNVISYHEAEPRLQYFSNFAYHNQERKEVLTKMIDAARMELILGAYNKRKIYVECNQCLTFFAPVISELFKESKFVHIVRHPGDFVRGGIRKGWHRNDSIWESGRVRMIDEKEWNRLDQMERLSWVWWATNQFIEEFKKQVSSQRVITFRIEELFNSEGRVKKFLKFIAAEEISADKIQDLQKTRINKFRIGPDEPPNMKKMDFFPKYKEWGNDLRDKANKFAKELAVLYGYSL